MNVAFYDVVDQVFREHSVLPKASPEEVRALVSMLQLEALQNGDVFEDIFFVAWDGKAKGYTSVFVLHDPDFTKLNDALLDSIKNKALQISRRK